MGTAIEKWTIDEGATRREHLGKTRLHDWGTPNSKKEYRCPIDVSKRDAADCGEKGLIKKSASSLGEPGN